MVLNYILVGCPWDVSALTLVLVNRTLTWATSLQRPLSFVPADSSYIASCLNLFTTATSLQQQRPLKRVPKVRPRQQPVFFPATDTEEEKRHLIRMAWRWWLIAAVLLCILTVFHLYYCREHKLSTLLIAKAANLARSVTLWLNTLIIQVFCVPYLYVLLIYGWITIMGYSEKGLNPRVIS